VDSIRESAFVMFSEETVRAFETELERLSAS
jgi:hypothetical protein